jgi:hypothetical protein
VPKLSDIVTQSLKRRLGGLRVAPTQTANLIEGLIEDLGDMAEQDITDHIAAVTTVSTAAAATEKLARVSAGLAPVRFDGQPSPEYLRLGSAEKIARTEVELRKATPTGVPWRTPWL